MALRDGDEHEFSRMQYGRPRLIVFLKQRSVLVNVIRLCLISQAVVCMVVNVVGINKRNNEANTEQRLTLQSSERIPVFHGYQQYHNQRDPDADAECESDPKPTFDILQDEISAEAKFVQNEEAYFSHI
ncbi:MAG: hypothetical protein M1836_003020 [Candelina mexicana]|nr:MAG: hypothetical protein M1836_003020 [Candelina mexicana]